MFGDETLIFGCDLGACFDGGFEIVECGGGGEG